MIRVVASSRQMALLIGAVALVGLLACTSDQTTAPAPTPTPVPASARDLLLPDLKAAPPAVMYIQINPDTGERKLWFSTTVTNVGDGPLEMIGIYDKQLDKMRAIQRIKTKEGTFEERVAGYFIFHEAHDDWHFQDFVELEIFSLDSAWSPAILMITTGKTTYCLHDVARLPLPPPNAPEKAVYPGCDPVIQGLSVGWADTYDPTIEGQQLNIENLPDGRYMIRTTADPIGRILEKDENNNSSIGYVEIRGTEINVISPPPITPPAMKIEVLVRSLEVPWAIAFAPDGRIFFTERPGRIRVVEDGRLQDEPWMSLDVAAVGEGGLLGLALDPKFTENHYVYVAYTYRATGGLLQNRLVRLREDPATGKGILDEVLLDNVPAGGIHDGGRVKFGSDGKLYWTVGEAGNPELAQDRLSPNGKILRINSDGTIPDDNPFVGSPVYSYGHRNPQGLAWQLGTGRLYSTEHGPSGGSYGVAQDEVNYIEPGKNYGWPLIIGSDTREGMVTPIIQSGESETWAPSGATFVTGGSWDGSMLFTGLRGQSLYRLVLDKDNPRKIISFEKYLAGQFGRLRDVVQGPDGALYILTNNRDGRGSPREGDDKILRLTLQ